MKKKYLAYILCVMLSGGLLFSYFTDETSRVNILKIGTNEVEIEEEMELPDIIPGSSFLKKPQIKNTGTVDCYVRTFIEFSDSYLDDQVSYDLNTTNWVKHSDGYYYYQHILPVNQYTTPLFTQVEVADTVTEGFDIIIYTESVQVIGEDPILAFSYIQ